VTLPPVPHEHGTDRRWQRARPEATGGATPLKPSADRHAGRVRLSSLDGRPAAQLRLAFDLGGMSAPDSEQAFGVQEVGDNEHIEHEGHRLEDADAQV